MIPKPVSVPVPVFIPTTCSLLSLVPHPSAQREEIIDWGNRAERKALHLPGPRAAVWVLGKLSGGTTGTPGNISKLGYSG